MAFFDNFGKKVTQISQDAVAKAKNVTDQAKLHSQISEEEKKISDTYRKIGELFYSVRGEQELPEYQTLIDEIDASNERIVELKHQLQAAKGVAICPECGAEVATNAAFCPNCGTKMPVSVKEEAPQDEPAESEDDAAEGSPESETQDEAVPETDAEAEASEEVVPNADTEE